MGRWYQSPTVWTEAGDLGGSLVIKVQETDGDILNIQINDGFAAFVGAGGLLLA